MVKSWDVYVFRGLRHLYLKVEGYKGILGLLEQTPDPEASLVKSCGAEGFFVQRWGLLKIDQRFKPQKRLSFNPCAGID
jgi:hypothetical protein